MRPAASTPWPWWRDPPKNATLARELLVGLRERGLDVSRPILVVLDGAKALRRAVLDVFDHPVIQHCQQHKIGNVCDRLPEKLRGVVEQRMRAAYQGDSSVEAEGQLLRLARELERTHPGAAASLKEGLQETLTVIPPGPLAHAPAHPALHQSHRVTALHLPRARP